MLEFKQGTKRPIEPKRERMNQERESITHKFTIIGADKQFVEDDKGKTVIKYLDIDGYITVGLYDDGRPGEIFLTIGKQGGPYAVYNSLMTSVSVGLQYGIPIEVFIDKFKDTKFEPAGMTKNPEIPIAKSVLDYVSRWLKMKFGEVKDGNSGSCKGNSEG